MLNFEQFLREQTIMVKQEPWAKLAKLNDKSELPEIYVTGNLKKQPSWASWLAVDKDGTAHYFQNQPWPNDDNGEGDIDDPSTTGWEPEMDDNGDEGEVEVAGKFKPQYGWKRSKAALFRLPRNK